MPSLFPGVFAAGITCGKAVSAWVVSRLAVLALSTARTATMRREVDKGVFITRFMRRLTAGLCAALNTNFTLLSSLLYTLSTRPISNRNYRN